MGRHPLESREHQNADPEQDDKGADIPVVHKHQSVQPERGDRHEHESPPFPCPPALALAKRDQRQDEYDPEKDPLGSKEEVEVVAQIRRQRP